MNIWNIFNKSENKKPYQYENILHMWEDDYLMIEILPFENLEFIKTEKKRIREFSDENFDGTGFTDVTLIGEKPVKTIDKKYLVDKVVDIIKNTGLKRIEKVVMQGVGLLSEDKVPLGFGTNKFALIIEAKDNFVEHIWFTGRTQTEEERDQLFMALTRLGQDYEMVGVNWYQGEYFNLKNDDEIKEFIKYSC